MCFGGPTAAPVPPAPPPPPKPAAPQTVDPKMPDAPTPAPEQTDMDKKPVLKKRETSAVKRERMRTGTASLQTAPGTGLNISANVQRQ